MNTLVSFSHVTVHMHAHYTGLLGSAYCSMCESPSVRTQAHVHIALGSCVSMYWKRTFAKRFPHMCLTLTWFELVSLQACAMIEKLLTPDDQTMAEHKRLQLRELASLNGECLAHKTRLNTYHMRNFTYYYMLHHRCP